MIPLWAIQSKANWKHQQCSSALHFVKRVLRFPKARKNGKKGSNVVSFVAIVKCLDSGNISTYLTYIYIQIQTAFEKIFR